MVEWNSGMEYWNDRLSIKSDVWGGGGGGAAPQ